MWYHHYISECKNLTLFIWVFIYRVHKDVNQCPVSVILTSLCSQCMNTQMNRRPVKKQQTGFLPEFSPAREFQPPELGGIRREIVSQSPIEHLKNSGGWKPRGGEKSGRLRDYCTSFFFVAVSIKDKSDHDLQTFCFSSTYTKTLFRFLGIYSLPLEIYDVKMTKNTLKGIDFR